MDTKSTEAVRSQDDLLDVLFIDDSANLCRAMALWLSSSGYCAKTAGTAAEGERIANRYRPRVIITDIGLPDGSGHELRQRLAETAGLAETHFIALSGKRSRLDAEHAVEAGFDTYIAKPPDFQILSELLQKFLPDPKQRDAASTFRKSPVHATDPGSASSA